MAAQVEYQLHKASGNQHYYWRVVSTGNNKVLATSETYWNRDDAIRAGNLVRLNSGSNADFKDHT